MKKNIFNLFFTINLLFSGFIIIATLPAAAAELSNAEAINIAGRQRMLTQRITKSYCQIGLDISPHESRQQLDDAIELFSTQLAELKQFESSPEIVNALGDIESQWKIFSDLARSTPNLGDAKRLAAMDEQLLQASERIVAQLEDLSGISASRIVNISGRQRMLSQRLAKFYMLLSWDPGSSSVVSEMDRAKNEFYGALHTLVEASENTPAINQQLAEAKLQWGWLNSSLVFDQEAYFPAIVADTSEKMLMIMEKVTGLYERTVKNN